MKKILVSLSLAVAAFSSQARAEDDGFNSPLWVCRLGFKGVAEGLQVIVGEFDLKATGTLHCLGNSRGEMSIPVKVKIESKPIDLKLAAGRFKVYGQSGAISLLTSHPEELLGTYLVAQAQASVVAGAGLITAFHTDLDDAVLSISLQFLKGVGVNIGLNKMVIELDEERAESVKP